MRLKMDEAEQVRLDRLQAIALAATGQDVKKFRSKWVEITRAGQHLVSSWCGHSDEYRRAMSRETFLMMDVNLILNMARNSALPSKVPDELQDWWLGGGGSRGRKLSSHRLCEPG